MNAFLTDHSAVCCTFTNGINVLKGPSFWQTNSLISDIAFIEQMKLFIKKTIARLSNFTIDFFKDLARISRKFQKELEKNISTLEQNTYIHWRKFWGIYEHQKQTQEILCQN